MTRRVCAVVEGSRHPGRNPLLVPLAERLAERGVELTTWDPTSGFALPPAPPAAALYLLKGDHPAVRSAAACLGSAGATCLNDVGATLRAADKAATVARLAASGVPVPHSAVVDASGLADAASSGPVYVKPIHGAHGDGVRCLRPGDPLPPGDGPWLVQEAIPGPGYDLKVYGVEERIAVRRVEPSSDPIRAVRRRIPGADPAIPRVARAAADAAGLTCFGVDVIASPAGPVIVDVNAFPGYRGVPEAAAWVADAVVTSLRGHR